MKESIIQRSILDWLELYSRTNKVYYFRAGSGKIRIAQNRYFTSGKPGVPDIVLCLTCKNNDGNIIGVFTGFEIKTATGRISKVQKQAKEDIINSGGYYYIIRSISDAKEAIKKTIQEVSKL